jgi:hypothetical protein
LYSGLALSTAGIAGWVIAAKSGKSAQLVLRIQPSGLTLAGTL